MLWGTLRNNYVTLNINHLYCLSCQKIFHYYWVTFIKKHFNITMSYSCILSYTPFSVLGAKNEIFSTNERSGSKINALRGSYAYAQYGTTPKTDRTKEEPITHTHKSVLFVFIQTWKVNLSSHTLSSVSLYCCVCLLYFPSYIFPAILNLSHNTMTLHVKQI